MHRPAWSAHTKIKKTTTTMRVPQYGQANLMGAFSQMQGSTASNPDFIGYQ